jgi:molybdenum cofactor cytidylyltransferase
VSAAGLILAAGESKRMGFPKALLEFQGETFLDRLIAAFSPFCDPVMVVLGCGAEEIRSGIRRPGHALFARNEAYSLGQLSSMQCGLRALEQAAPREDLEGVLFTLVDHPNVRPSTLAALLTPPHPALAIPRYEGRRGHPMFISAALIPEFLALPADSQAKAVVARHADRTRYVDVSDPGVLDDVDDPAAYRRLLETA